MPAAPMRLLAALLAASLLASCTAAGITATPSRLASAPREASASPGQSTRYDALIGKYAAIYDIPGSLIHRVVKRESRYNAGARNGPYWGLMQIRHDTAGTMGYRGPARGLLDAETNLKYAVKYLAGAYLVAGGNSDQAMRLYARGYYYDAKRKGLLEETGLRPSRR